MSTTPKVKAPDTLREQIAQLQATLNQARDVFVEQSLGDTFGKPTFHDLSRIVRMASKVDVSIEGRVLIYNHEHSPCTEKLAELPRLHY